MTDKLILFTAYWDMLGDGTGYETDYRGLKPRRFKFDVAFIAEQVAVEIDGGVWTGGRHTRGKGYTSDCVKNNLAISRGWDMFRFTPQMIEEDPHTAIEMVKARLKVKRKASEGVNNG